MVIPPPVGRIIAGATPAFVRVMWELGATMMEAGIISGKTTGMPVRKTPDLLTAALDAESEWRPHVEQVVGAYGLWGA